MNIKSENKLSNPKCTKRFIAKNQITNSKNINGKKTVKFEN